MIRRMSESDLDAVAALWLDCNLDAHSFIDPGYWKAVQGAVRAGLASAEVYIYEDALGLEGFIGLNGGYVEGLFVRGASRSKGIGARLLSLAKSMRDELSLSVYVKNSAAVRFYEREGFTVTGKGVDGATGEAEYAMTWKRG